MYRNADNSSEEYDLQEDLSYQNRKLSKEESESLEGYIFLKEAAETLFKMKSNRSPGSDGFTSEFFEVLLK